MKNRSLYLIQIIIIAFFFILVSFNVKAQEIDVLHYAYKLELSDETDQIKGEARIMFRLLQPDSTIFLDLVQLQGNGKGMKVSRVQGSHVVQYRQADNRLYITLNNSDTSGIYTVQVNYTGIPADGLIISKNKYGDRTFFADNWPNRAHHWIPCADHPDDKATFEFSVIAPQQYQVISNGAKVEEKLINNNRRFTHWEEDVALPSKVMVIGVARFAVKTYGDSPANIPVSAWVFPQDSVKGFYDYGVAPSILAFFSNYIASYPYNKLANVQSRTIFGGMENASAIFYAEESVTGTRKWEDVLAHEIAHQWFGDMASEKSFAHLWLSEGFATYMTDFYIENKYGKDSANKRLQKERREVEAFVRTYDHPVVDNTSNLMALLNANSYQKGGWILHMLRNETGDDTFRQIIQTYYRQYRGANADTRDFEHIAEQVSHKDLKWFFDQWLYQPGIPQLDVLWEWKDNRLMIKTNQKTIQPYKLPLEVAIVTEKGTLKDTLLINSNDQVFSLSVPERPIRLILDPDTKLLFTGVAINTPWVTTVAK